jgi:membrane protein DedA with SNARE-associated domain
LKKFANTLVAWGPLGLFLLTLLDSAGIPLPGVVDTLLVFLASRTPSLWFVYGAIAVTGSMIGCMILFYLARLGGEKFLDRRTENGRGAKFKEWYLRYGLITVFIPAISVIPITLKVPAFCAGALGVPVWNYAAVILLARCIRYFGLAYFGSLMGDNALAWINTHKAVIGGSLAALAAALGVLAWLANRGSRSAMPARST